jgi:hypothetical protein
LALAEGFHDRKADASTKGAPMGERIHGLGHLDIVPPLNTAEQQYLRAYAETTTRVDEDPYHVDDHPPLARRRTFDTEGDDHYVISGRDEMSWAPDFSGESLHTQDRDGIWHPLECLQHLLDHFLTPDAAQRHAGDERFKEFTFDHELLGAVALESDYTGQLTLVMVRDGQVQSLVASQCVGCGYGESGLTSTWELSAGLGVAVVADPAQLDEDLHL